MTSSSPSTNTDPYVWVGPSSGRWRDGANWQDQTTGDTGSFPSVHNAVQFGVDTPDQQTPANDTVAGIGRSASLTLFGDLTLAGTFRTGALGMAPTFVPINSYLTSTLTVTGAGNSLQARSALGAGNLDVGDGAAVNVAGSYEIESDGTVTPNPTSYELYAIRVDGAGSRMTIGGVLSADNSSIVEATNGGYLEARRMVLDHTVPIGDYSVDAQSTIEVGTLGNAAAGTWTIDPARVLVIENDLQLSAPEFVVNGWIDDVDGLDLTGSPGNVTGTGRIRIEANAPLTIGQSGDQLSVVFKGSGGELSLADGAAAFTSTIRQFAAGNSIQISDLTFDSATWQRGVLSLFDGGTLVGSLKLAGRYAGDMFSVGNDTITLDSGSVSGSTAESMAPRSLQLFTQAMASFERHTSPLHDVSAGGAQHAIHPVLAAAMR